MILIIGHLGSMGRRYQAILNYLNVPFVGVDNETEFLKLIHDFEGYIITTPTETHYRFIKTLAPRGKPILCEKPLTVFTDELDELYEACDENNAPLTMMNQYIKIPHSVGDGLTSYNFYNHGKDGMIWDCIQVIGLATGEIELREDSPTWKCTINGEPISIAQMDRAYVNFVDEWLKYPNAQERLKVIKAHLRCRDIEEEHNASINSNPST